MARDLSELTWVERAQHDPSLRAFVDAEIARAGIELDTLRHQHGIDTRRIAALLTHLEAAHKTIAKLRRQLGRDTRLPEDVGGDAA